MRSTIATSQPVDRRSPSSSEFVSTLARPSDAEALRRSSWTQLYRAGLLQRSLLPKIGGPLGGYRLATAYRPCEALCCDFYDILCQPGRSTLVVADVMGHGAEAALITMLLKAVFHETAPHIGDTDELLSVMNERLLGLIPAGSFAATAVAQLDSASSEIQCSNAGLPYPFVLRAATRSVDEVILGGVPLGLNIDTGPRKYDTCRVKLEPGDVLLIASDGIGSIEDRDGRCFEDLHLRRALKRLVGLTGETVIESLLADAIDFSNGQPFPDDINLVAVCRDAASGTA